MKGARVLVLGVAHKKDVDDLRESPSLKIMQMLGQRGANVEYSDPYFPELHKMRHYDYAGMRSAELTPANIGKYDCVAIATDHSNYDYQAIVESAQLVVDTRNATRRVRRNRNRIVLC
jgi:UDP-N-acetyl-D-glucosamine dehydrogenase